MFLSPKVAAIEFAENEVRVALVKPSGKKPRILGLFREYAEYETPEERAAALSAALERALAKMRGNAAAYVLCVPATQCVARGLTIPFRGARRVSAAVPFELEPHLAFPIEDLIVDYDTIAEIGGETEVLAMAMRRDQLAFYTEILSTQGIEPDAVMADVAALTALWRTQARVPAKGMQAVLHLRATGSNLAVLYNRRLAFVRPLQCTAAQFAESPLAAAREAQNSIRAFLAKWRGEGEIASISITGIDLDPEQIEAAREAFGIEVEPLSMVRSLPVEEPERVEGNVWEAAIGAAVEAANATNGIDLARGETNWQTAMSGMTGYLMVSACLALLCLAGWAFHYYQATRQNAEQRREVQSQIEETKKEVDRLKGQGLGGDGLDLEAFRTPTVLAVLQEVVQRMPQDQVSITGVVIHAPGSRGAWLTITGKANDAASFNAAFENLKKSELFVVDESPEQNLSEGKTLFTVKASRAHGEDEEETAEKNNES